MTSPAIIALRASHDRLRSIVDGLDPAWLNQPGYPSEWTIAQVLSHLGSGAEINHLLLDAGLAGTGAPSRDAYPPIWDAWNGKPASAQAADALVADARLVASIEANADSDATFEMWTGPTDIDGFALTRLAEHAVHTWDVAVAVDPSATVSADAVALLLDRLGQLIGFAAKPKNWTGVVHVATTAPDREFALTLGDRSSLADSTGEPADARLALPAEAFVRLVYGRLDPAHTPPLEVSGVDIDELRAAFPGF
jgi:uncharacterized protein (TIGR03083 family)